MRIIAGEAKGRRLRRPAPGTRPFTDKNREALFSSLGRVVDGANVLDLYAGVGSLGLEALSRGATSAVFVESSPPALAILRENVSAVGLGGDVVAHDVESYIAGAVGSFDLAFVDPPYDLPLASVEELMEELVQRLGPGATVIVHRRFGEPAPDVSLSFELVWDRRYGDARIWRYEVVTEGV